MECGLPARRSEPLVPPLEADQSTRQPRSGRPDPAHPHPLDGSGAVQVSVHHDDRARGIVFRCRGSGCVTRLPAEGRFLWADDFWGTRAWDNWSGEIAKALPPATYPIVDLPLDHELFHTLYDVRELPQIPSIGFWIETRGATSGMSRALLKLSGSLVHDYATISDDSPSPNRASRARRAATSAGIS